MIDAMLAGSDEYLIGIPLIIVLFIALFRVDELISTPKKSLKRRRPSYQMDEDGVPVLSDPDGLQSRVHSPAGNQPGPSRQSSLDADPLIELAEPPGNDHHLSDNK
ncbi:MAG: hypothetical protein ACLQLH_15490 [Terracidiphilus sp.]